MTTSDYLEQLVQDRDDLVDNLTTKGITGLIGDETFTELVPEVLNIPSGGMSVEDEMRLCDLNIKTAIPLRPYSEKDYTSTEVAKVEELINNLGGN